jgi:hypothetical protein
MGNAEPNTNKQKREIKLSRLFLTTHYLLFKITIFSR